MFVIAQIQFSQTPSLVKEKKQVTEAFYNLGLTVPDVKQQSTFTMTAPQNPPQVVHRTVLQFSESTRQRVVVLSENSLVLYDAAYGSFSEFKSRMTSYVGLVCQNAKGPCTLASVSLRYISGFKSETQPSRFLQPGLYGLRPECVETSHFHHEYKFWCDAKGGGRLTVVAKTVHGNELVPKELQPFGLAMKPEFALRHADNAVSLDIYETVRTGAAAMDQLTVESALSGMRGRAKAAFRAATTDEAHEQWGME